MTIAHHFAFHRKATAMNEDDAKRLAAAVEELRDGQKLQIERQLEALDLQRQLFAIVQNQAARTERIQDKAELLQDRSAKLVQGSRRFVVVLVPVIVALIVYVTWLIFKLHR
jgi:hypothetical protein